MTTADLLAALAKLWAEQEIERGPAVSPEELDAWEARHGCTLPADAREYFLALNGFDGGEARGQMDAELITFWNLSEVRPLSEEAPLLGVPDAGSYFAFADHLMWSHAYALFLPSDERMRSLVVLVEDDQPTALTLSLSAFLEGYLRSDKEILFPRRPQPWLPEPARPSARQRLRWLLRRLFVRGGEVKPRLRNRAAMERRLTRFLGRLKADHPHLLRVRSGTVILSFRVDDHGRVDLVEVTAPGPIPELADEAVRLAPRMRFAPARIDRTPVAVLVELPLSFYFPP